MSNVLRRFADIVGVTYALTTTSGSSANLPTFITLILPSLGDRTLKQGDDVISAVAGFQATARPHSAYQTARHVTF